MEESLLAKLKATTTCGVCGTQGDWATETVRGPKRHLVCRHCNVGRAQIAVTEDDVTAALAG